jgi:hypothetical protein
MQDHHRVRVVQAKVGTSITSTTSTARTLEDEAQMQEDNGMMQDISGELMGQDSGARTR